MMKFYDALWSVNQRAHALAAHWCLLCEGSLEKADYLHAASLRDFLQVLRTERQEMDKHLDALDQEVAWAVALIEGAARHTHITDTTPFTYHSLCAFLKPFDLYLDKYPELSAAEVIERYLYGPLEHDEPLDENAP
jgi:hypothetical protein